MPGVAKLEYTHQCHNLLENHSMEFMHGNV